ncbi:hypothetical protein, partial [Leptolyngbya sp. FACHB-36]|uniref:hypothetical protein n=1 Tax=Leptolyngbya sp. FACHB-36 TaxID=2692808 RepID=UPI001A7E5A78
SLKCVTEMDMRARGMLHSRASVDHICLSEQLVSIASVTAWEGKRAGEPRMSDHNGVLVKFKL